MTLPESMHATILFAHGSRDPAWSAPMHHVAQRMRELEPQVCVRCAFLELTAPSLPDAVAELVALGATQITIVPMFLGIGKHAREDLPQLASVLLQRYPALQLIVKPSVGEEPRVIDALAQQALTRPPCL